jgi:hypothetical protein
MSLAAIPFDAATQAQQEAATSLVVGVTPGRQHFHPSACKAWIRFDGTGTPASAASNNITSITDNGTGSYTLNLTTAMSSGNYAALGMNSGTTGESNGRMLMTSATDVPTTTAVTVLSLSPSGFADQTIISVALFGDM